MSHCRSTHGIIGWIIEKIGNVNAGLNMIVGHAGGTQSRWVRVSRVQLCDGGTSREA